jgi:hypothetical protein
MQKPEKPPFATPFSSFRRHLRFENRAQAVDC